MEVYKPKDFGQLIGRSVITLQRWDRLGILKSHRSPTNRRYYTHDQLLIYRGLKADESKKAVVYARVSSNGQKSDLKNQMKAIECYCIKNNIAIDEWVQEIGSGLNYKRKNFNRLLNEIESGQIKLLVIAEKDRLVRFGYEWFESFCERHGAKIITINEESLSPEQELVQDLLSIVHVFSARLYGLRSYKKVIRDAALQKNKS